jgi:(S)-mandelate dehydrogenase
MRSLHRRRRAAWQRHRKGALLGRATLYGVAAAGQSGAERALSILAQEFRRTMQLCGARNVSELGRHLLSAED